MQVKINHSDGEWHRVMLDPSGASGAILETSCEVSIEGKYYATRNELLEGKLCPDCFTPGEIRRALAYAAAAAQRHHDELVQAEADREDWFERGVRKRASERMKALGKTEEKP